jgi:hypothetical protein
MAESEKIKSTDVIAKDLFKNTEQSADSLNVSLNELEISFISILNIQQKILTQSVKTAKDVTTHNKALKDSKIARDGLYATQKMQLDLAVKEEKVKQAQIKTQNDLNKQAKVAVTEAEKQAKAAAKLKTETDKLNSVYVQQSKKLREMKKAVQELLASEKALTEADKKLIKETQLLDDKLKKIDRTIGDGHRSVGLYADGIKEAIAGTRLFDGEIAHTLVQLKSLVKQFKENTEGANKFSNGLKLLAVGGAIAGIGGLIAVFNKLKDVNQNVADATEKLNLQLSATGSVLAQSIVDSPFLIFIKNINLGFGNAFELAKAASDNQKNLSEKIKESKVAVDVYADSLIKSRAALRALREQTEKLILDEQDFAEISADTTIGFAARNAALKESQALQVQIADKQIKSARIEATIAANRVKSEEANVGKGKVLNEFLDKQLETQQELDKALDKRADLTRQFDEQQRARNIDQASFEVDLILKKKQSANADKIILENKLQDEKLQLEERRKVANELLSVNKKTTQEEFDIFKKTTGLKFSENALLNEQDAVALQKRLEGIKQEVTGQDGLKETVGIGTEATVLLAKIVKNAQENQIANAEQLKKLQEEEIARLHTIAELEREINAINAEQEIKLQQDAIDEQAGNHEKLNETILEQEKVFNRKLEAIRKKEVENIQKNEQDVTNLKLKQLDQRAQDEKNALEVSEKDDAIRVEKIKKIDAQLEIDKDNLIIESNQKRQERAEKEANELRKIELRKTEIIVTELQKVTQALSDEIDKKNDKRIEEADKEISLREKSIEKQTKLAEDGKANQLAFEVAAQEKAELRKKEIEEKAAREKEAIALVESYTAFLLARLNEANANPNTAPFLALKDTLLARGVAKGLVGFFAEGVEDLQGGGTKTSDSIPAMLSKGESVLTADATAANRGLATAANNGELDKYLLSNWLPKFDLSKNDNDNKIQNSLMLNELAAIRNEIKNKPVQIWQVNEIGELIEKRITSDLTEKITYKPRHRFK